MFREGYVWGFQELFLTVMLTCVRNGSGDQLGPPCFSSQLQ